MGNTIFLPRGDIRLIRLKVCDASGEVFSKSLTDVYFTVKETYEQWEPTISKSLSAGTISKVGDDYVIVLKPEDTDGLKFGSYVYDIELVRGDILKQTFVGNLVITKEVTHADNEWR